VRWNNFGEQSSLGRQGSNKARGNQFIGDEPSGVPTQICIAWSKRNIIYLPPSSPEFEAPRLKDKMALPYVFSPRRKILLLVGLLCVFLTRATAESVYDNTVGQLSVTEIEEQLQVRVFKLDHKPKSNIML
jgi:hypothetical protein